MARPSNKPFNNWIFFLIKLLLPNHAHFISGSIIIRTRVESLLNFIVRNQLEEKTNERILEKHKILPLSFNYNIKMLDYHRVTSFKYDKMYSFH